MEPITIVTIAVFGLIGLTMGINLVEKTYEACPGRDDINENSENKLLFQFLNGTRRFWLQYNISQLGKSVHYVCNKRLKYQALSVLQFIEGYKNKLNDVQKNKACNVIDNFDKIIKGFDRNLDLINEAIMLQFHITYDLNLMDDNKRERLMKGYKDVGGYEPNVEIDWEFNTIKAEFLLG